MVKRSWSLANDREDQDSSPSQASNKSNPQPTKAKKIQPRAASPANATTDGGVAANGNGQIHGGAWGDQPLPQISRKIKACAACRRHKIKCVMDESGPPCRRCAERSLGCVLSKNLQSIIDEKSQYSEAVAQDLEMMHSALKELVRNANMAELPPLQSVSLRDAQNSPPTDALATSSAKVHNRVQYEENHGPSCDNSPKISPEDEGLSYVPIQSLYALTKLRALRSPDATEVRNGLIDDFISRGAIRLVDAERLFALYRDRLDSFMYGVGCRYQTLHEMRGRSTILTAATLTVAALHDKQADDIYGICSSEFRQLMEKSMFDRHVDRDYLRAMCVASYWLSDMSWMLSGYAIRRAAECNLHKSHTRLITEQTEEAADCARLWYILYICDQHLATLYGRPSIVQEDSAISGWESFLSSPVSNNEDKRLASQVALLSILRSIRDLFGPDKGEAIPRVYLNQIAHFNRKLDQWIGHWSVALADTHQRIGRFPRKGALLHFHFAKLHLYSHIFRGLPGDVAIPHYFVDCASSAIQAATSIIDFIRSDPDVSAGVIGVPSYLHSMTAFACMFLIKVAVKYGGDLINRERVQENITSLVEQFRSLPVGKWHLANLMAGGLEKMVATLRPKRMEGQPSQPLHARNSTSGMMNVMNQVPEPDAQLFELESDLFFDYGMSFGLSPVFRLDPSLGLQGQTTQLSDFADVDYRMHPQS